MISRTVWLQLVLFAVITLVGTGYLIRREARQRAGRFPEPAA